MNLPAGISLGSGEELKYSLRPHPLAFGRYHALALAYFVSALLLQNVFTGIAQTSFPFVEYGELALFWILLILPALVVGILWVSKQPLVYSSLVGIAGTILVAYFGMTPASSLPALLAGASIVAVVLVEAYRRSHRYLVTDRRVVLSKSFISRTSREVHYSKITDLAINQGLLGRLFNFGTIIPVSQSGMGLGEDTAGTGAGVAYTRGRITVGGGVFGSKGVSVPRSATYYSLNGISRVHNVANVISEFIHASEEAPYLKRIEGLLKEGAGPRPRPGKAEGEKEKKEIEQEA